jgi:methionyl-tRNA formyltransferase
MNLLLLGPTPESLLSCIDTRHDKVFTCNEEIDERFVLKRHIEFIVSYNYRYIISPDVLSAPNLFAINLHASLLPFNRGAHPILWSILEGSPLGVTIHQIDQGLDKGPIIFQRQLALPGKKITLRQAYADVNQELVNLFCINWPNLSSGNFKARSQLGVGTFHRSAQARDFLAILNNSWDTTIEDARRDYTQYLQLK